MLLKEEDEIQWESYENALPILVYKLRDSIFQASSSNYYRLSSVSGWEGTKRNLTPTKFLITLYLFRASLEKNKTKKNIVMNALVFKVEMSTKSTEIACKIL